MLVSSALYLSGLICVRLTSAFLTYWDPFELVATYSALRDIGIDDPDNEYNNLYFQDMCNFFSAAFVNSYIGLYVPTATQPKGYQVYIDSLFSILAMLGLHVTFFFARYCFKIVLIACVFGAFWGVVMVNIIHWVRRCVNTKRMQGCIQWCGEKFEKREERCDAESPAAQPLTRSDIYVY